MVLGAGGGQVTSSELMSLRAPFSVAACSNVMFSAKLETVSSIQCPSRTIIATVSWHGVGFPWAADSDPLGAWRAFRTITGQYGQILDKNNKYVGCSATKNDPGVCLWCYLSKNPGQNRQEEDNTGSVMAIWVF